MLLNADQLLAVFPYPVLTKIVGEPNLASITLQQIAQKRPRYLQPGLSLL